ncbi:hypothetical protein GTV32_04790 [Gordonia sp. SID5947]|uniref:hypothetical protein n=1 Tax=Gordonia sp. SID5947 TaxID=2690315 RepID=UPI001367BB07|nr:hypothetical protein [Gordonia sp. SID5947]MYR05670.1 hypothetical protein [Gordonia sp. SID5947]
MAGQSFPRYVDDLGEGHHALLADASRIAAADACGDQRGDPLRQMHSVLGR